jgi:hypothetical protein
VPRGRTWDAVVSAHAPDISGEGVAFVALDDGTLITEEELPDDSLAPLAEAVEQLLSPPYRVAAVRTESDVWRAVAESVAIVELRDVEGEAVDVTVVDGVREVTIDGQPTTRSLPALDTLAKEHGDVALHAERVDGHLFAVDVFPL